MTCTVAVSLVAAAWIAAVATAGSIFGSDAIAAATLAAAEEDDDVSTGPTSICSGAVGAGAIVGGAIGAAGTAGPGANRLLGSTIGFVVATARWATLCLFVACCTRVAWCGLCRNDACAWADAPASETIASARPTYPRRPTNRMRLLSLDSVSSALTQERDFLQA